MSPTQKRLAIIIGVVLLFLLLGGGLLYIFVFKNKDSDNQSNEQSTSDDTADNSDDSTDDDSTSGESLEAPNHVLYSSEEAYALLLAEAKTWAPDAQVSMLQGIINSIQRAETRIFYGESEGKFDVWSANLYSKSLGQTNSVMLVNGTTSIGTPFDIDDMIVSAYDQMAYISNINTFITSVELYQLLTVEGLDTESNIYNVYLMFDDDLNGWYYLVEERSKTDLDEYDSPMLVKEYTVNATTGELIE